MDEPTAALTAAEVERLFPVMREIAGRGVGIVYISHRLEEVPRVADRVTVMRDGQVAGVASAQRAAVGTRAAAGRPAARRALSAPRGAIRQAGAAPRARALPPQARARRLAGAGRRLARGARGRDRRARRHHGRRPDRASDGALRRRRPPAAGRGVVEIDGKPARLASIRGARGEGLGFVTDDRRGSGLHAARQRRAQSGPVRARSASRRSS